MKTKKLLAATASLIFLGAGCFGGSSDAGTATGGIWRSADAGKTWTHLTALPGPKAVGSIGGVNVTSIEIDPSDSSAYYLGTEANGLLTSLDAGATWVRPESKDVNTGAVLDVEVDPKNICVVYVLKSAALWKTNNCGRTYTSTYEETRAKEGLTSLAIDWFNGQTLWLGTSDGDVLKTTDGGANWAAVYRIKDKINAITVSGEGTGSDSRIVLVGTDGHGLYRTTDGGGSWIEYKDQLKSFKSSDTVYGFAQTKDGSTLVMSSKYGLLKSKDAGFTWQDVPLVTPHGDVRIWSLAVDPKNGDVITYGALSTFYRTSTGGSTWQTEDMPTGRAPKAMVIDHSGAEEIILTGFATIEK